MTEDFPRMPLPLTVMKPISRKRPNELSETIHLSKKKHRAMHPTGAA
jgi:hypothetical protein